MNYPGESDQNELDGIDDLDSSQRFLSADELMNNEEDDEDDTTDPSYSLPEDFGSELEKEVDADISPDDFWAIDPGNKTKEGENTQTSSDVLKSNMAGIEELDQKIRGKRISSKCIN